MMNYHQAVLLQESIDGLKVRPGGIYVDATFGGGGHSAAILNKLGEGRLLAFDQDEEALNNAPDDHRLTLIHHNFRYLKNFLRFHQVAAPDGILADLGVSSHQFDEASRGFSIRHGGKLDLRMNQKQKTNAGTILNEYTVEDLSRVFKSYGELANGYSIAKAIIKKREQKPVTDFEDLKTCLKHLEPKWKENKFYARIMQALRIEVNHEMDALEEFLVQAVEALKPGGRLVVISYHSLEDRPVKNLIKTGNIQGEVIKDFYGNIQRPLLAINKKPITPSEAEIEANNRARSARLRIAEKLNPGHEE